MNDLIVFADENLKKVTQINYIFILTYPGKPDQSVRFSPTGQDEEKLGRSQSRESSITTETMSDEIRGSREMLRSDSADSPRDSNHRSRLSSPRPDSGREDGASRHSDQQQRVSSHGNLSGGHRSQSPFSIRSVSPHPVQSPARALSPSPSRSTSREARSVYAGIPLSPRGSMECMNLDISRSRSPHPVEDREPYSSGYEEDHSEISSLHGRNTPSYRSKSPYHNPTSQLRYSHESKVSSSDDKFVASVHDERVKDGSVEDLDLSGLANYKNTHDFSPRPTRHDSNANNATKRPVGESGHDQNRPVSSNSTVDTNEVANAKYPSTDDVDAVEVTDPSLSTDSCLQAGNKERDMSKKEVGRVVAQGETTDWSNNSVKIGGIGERLRRDTHGPTMRPKMVNGTLTMSSAVDSEDEDDLEGDDRDGTTPEGTDWPLAEPVDIWLADSNLRSVLKNSDSVTGERTNSRVHFHDIVDEISYPSEDSFGMVHVDDTLEKHKQLWGEFPGIRSSGDRSGVSPPPNTPESLPNTPQSSSGSSSDSENNKQDLVQDSGLFSGEDSCGSSEFLSESSILPQSFPSGSDQVLSDREISDDSAHALSEYLNSDTYANIHQGSHQWRFERPRPPSASGRPRSLSVDIRRNVTVVPKMPGSLNTIVPPSPLPRERRGSITSDFDESWPTSFSLASKSPEPTSSVLEWQEDCELSDLEEIDLESESDSGIKLLKDKKDQSKTPTTELIQNVPKREEKQCKEEPPDVPDTTPSQLHSKVETREARQRAPSPLADFAEGTPSALFEKVLAAEKRKRSFTDATQSKLVGRTPAALHTKASAAGQRRASLGSASSPSPSEQQALAAIRQVRKTAEMFSSPSVQLTDGTISSVYNRVLAAENKRISTLYERVRATAEMLTKIVAVIDMKTGGSHSLASLSRSPVDLAVGSPSGSNSGYERNRTLSSMSASTPSKLLAKVETREARQAAKNLRSPSVDFGSETPSSLFEKVQRRAENNDIDEASKPYRRRSSNSFSFSGDEEDEVEQTHESGVLSSAQDNTGEADDENMELSSAAVRQKMFKHLLYGQEHHTVSAKDGSEEVTFFESNDRRSSLPIAQSPSEILRRKLAQKVEAKIHPSSDSGQEEDESPSSSVTGADEITLEPTEIHGTIENGPLRAASRDALSSVAAGLSRLSEIGINLPVDQYVPIALPEAQGDDVLAVLSVADLAAAFGHTASELIGNILDVVHSENNQENANEENTDQGNSYQESTDQDNTDQDIGEAKGTKNLPRRTPPNKSSLPNRQRERTLAAQSERGPINEARVQGTLQQSLSNPCHLDDWDPVLYSTMISESTTPTLPNYISVRSGSLNDADVDTDSTHSSVSLEECNTCSDILLNLPSDYDERFLLLDDVMTGGSQGTCCHQDSSSDEEEEQHTLHDYDRHLYCAGVPGLIFGHCHKVHDSLVNAATETIQTESGNVRVLADCENTEPCKSEPRCIFNVPGMIFTGDTVEKVCRHGKKQVLKIAVPMEEIFPESTSLDHPQIIDTQYPSHSTVTNAGMSTQYPSHCTVTNAGMSTQYPSHSTLTNAGMSTQYPSHSTLTTGNTGMSTQYPSHSTMGRAVSAAFEGNRAYSFIRYPDDPANSTSDSGFGQDWMTSTTFDQTSDFDHSYSRQMNGSPSPSPRPDSEKEVLESQMRKMQVEMSSLQSENKLVKERYNRSQARITELESQVADSQKEHDRLVEEFNNEIAALKRKARSEQDLEKQESNRKISSLTKECEMHKAENSSLEKQLDLSRKSGASNTKVQMDKIKTVETLRAELAAHKDQLAKIENLYQESEKQRFQEAERRKEAAHHIVRLTEMKNMLQQQVESGSAGTVTEKQLDSYQVQLDQKAGIIRQLSGTEHDNRHVVESLQQNLDAAQVDLTDRAIELHETKQDLAKEKTVSAQLKTEKLEVQQKMEAVADERDMYKREKDLLENELQKRDSEVKMATRQMEEETRKIHSEKEDQVKNISTANKKVVLELEAAKRQVEAKEREIGTLNENAVRLKDEIESQRKKVALLKEENTRCREDQQRLQEELTTRVKENSASVEVNQRLVNEKTALQMEKYQLQKDLDKEREILALKKEEVAELIRKLDKIDDQHRNTEKQVHEKENRIVALETELHHTNKSQNHLQSDHGQLKVQIDHLTEELKNLTKTTGTLEKQLETEKAVLRQERTNGDKLRDEVSLEQQRVQLLQTDYDLVLNNLDAERRSLDKVKEQCRLLEEKASAEESRAEALGTELDTVKAQLVVTRETADQYKEDKQNLYAELQEMCQKLEDKEALVSHLQDKCDLQVERIQREMEQEKHNIHCDRESVEMQLLRVREENDDLKETVRQREIQVLANEKAIQDLESEMKARQELEVKQQQLQSELHDSKMLMGHMKTETISQKETIKQLQENMDKLKEHNASLREKLHEQQDRLHGDVAELKQVYHDNHSKLEKDKNDFKDKLNKTTAKLKAAEVALSNAVEAKEQLANSNKTLEKTAEMLKTQLHEEITNRKLAEQKIETMKLHLDDTKNKSTIFDDKVGFLQGQLAKAETELAITREKMKKVMDDMNDLEATLFAQEARAQTLQEQVLALETENNSLHHQLEAKKIQQQGKNRRASLELKQQLENFEKDRAKYNQQSQQLFHDLEKARQQISDKNKENLRLNEELLQMEEKYRDTSGQLKQVQDSNKLEGSLQNKLNAKVHELETENAALRATLAQLNNGDDIDTRHELNRMVQDLNAQLMERLEAQRNTEKEAQQREEKYAKDNKSKLYDLESQLNTEKAMHIITKNQLKAVEDDNHKLRNRLIQAKKNMGAAERAKHMSRMEEINELIARSQSRAQAMLATGCMDDHAFSPRDFGRSMTPHSNIHSPAPNSEASDSLSLSAGLLHMNATNNNSVFRPI